MSWAWGRCLLKLLKPRFDHRDSIPMSFAGEHNFKLCFFIHFS
jgi:hypothetical protein